MAMPMYKVALLLTCLACVGQGLQISIKTDQGSANKASEIDQDSQSLAEAQQSSARIQAAAKMTPLTALLAAFNPAAGIGFLGAAKSHGFAIRNGGRSRNLVTGNAISRPAITPRVTGAPMRFAVNDRNAFRQRAPYPSMSLNFAGMKAGELKMLLKERGVSIQGCFDKASLVERAEQYRYILEGPPPAPPWEGDDPTESGPPGAGAAACLILLHGFGDSGSGFISSMGGPLIAMNGLRVVFPSAPRQLIGGFPVSSWLQGARSASGAAAVRGSMMQADDSQAQASVDYIHSLIRREMARGIPADRIVVGGFSQGGLIATRAALSFPDASLGGALALSTFFGSDEAPVAYANKKLRVLVAHGEADSVVPVSEGQRVATSVRRLAPDANVEFKAYSGMGHSTCADEVNDLRAFLESVVGGRKTSEVTTAAEPAAEPSEIEAMTSAQLKAYLKERGVPTADCFERSDLVARALESV